MRKKKITRYGATSYKRKPHSNLLTKNQEKILSTLSPESKKSTRYAKKTNELIRENIIDIMKFCGPAIMKKRINKALDKKYIKEYDYLIRGFRDYYLKPIDFILSLIDIFLKHNRKQDVKRLFSLLNNEWIPSSLNLLLGAEMIGFNQEMEQAGIIDERDTLEHVYLWHDVNDIGRTIRNEYRHLTGKEMLAARTTTIHNYFLKNYPKIGKELKKLLKQKSAWCRKGDLP